MYREYKEILGILTGDSMQLILTNIHIRVNLASSTAVCNTLRNVNLLFNNDPAGILLSKAARYH